MIWLSRAVSAGSSLLKRCSNAQRRASGGAMWFTSWVAVEWRWNALSTRNSFLPPYIPWISQSYLLDMLSAYTLYLWGNFWSVNISENGEFNPPKLYALYCLCVVWYFIIIICNKAVRDRERYHACPHCSGEWALNSSNITLWLKVIVWKFSFPGCHLKPCWLTNTWIPLWFVINALWREKNPKGYKCLKNSVLCIC